MRKIVALIVGIVVLPGASVLRAAEPQPVANVPASMPVQTEAQRMAFAPTDKSPEAVINAFNQMAFFDRDPVGAMKKYLAPDFVERHPEFAVVGATSDKEGAIHFFETRGWKPEQTMKDEIYKIIADKDHAVILHRVTMDPAKPPIAFIDVFRVKDGLIVEHWAVGQPYPPSTTARHSMF